MGERTGEEGGHVIAVGIEVQLGECGPEVRELADGREHVCTARDEFVCPL